MSAPLARGQRRESLQIGSGIPPVPVCAWCGRVRDGHGRWHFDDALTASRDEDDFTHGICPACSAMVRARYRA